MQKQLLTNSFRKITTNKPFRICFVCLGNICRSPTAEGVFRHLVKERGLEKYFEIDSAGTSAYHIGEQPNMYSQKIAAQHGVSLESRAQQFNPDDGYDYDLILTMDYDNYEDVVNLDYDDDFSDKVGLFRSFDPQPEDYEVPDPYDGGLQGFERVFQIIYRTSEALLDELESHIV